MKILMISLTALMMTGLVACDQRTPQNKLNQQRMEVEEDFKEDIRDSKKEMKKDSRELERQRMEESRKNREMINDATKERKEELKEADEDYVEEVTEK